MTSQRKQIEIHESEFLMIYIYDHLIDREYFGAGYNLLLGILRILLENLKHEFQVYHKNVSEVSRIRESQEFSLQVCPYGWEDNSLPLEFVLIVIIVDPVGEDTQSEIDYRVHL